MKIKREPMKRISKNSNFIAGAVLTGMILLFIVIGCIHTPYDPEAMDGAGRFAGISWRHPMGCDNFGRDILSRVMTGAGTTLGVAFATVAIGAFFGVIWGAFAGYYGGLLDEIFMRAADAMLAFPSILLALMIIGLFGPGKYNVILALGIAFVPSFARIVRSEFIRCKNMDYVRSARLMGAGNLRIMFVHILPNAFPVILSSVLIGFNNAVLAEAGMNYLGIGVMPPDASLGRMLSEAQTYIFSAPGYAIFPGIVLILMILGFSLLGEGVRDN